jgi:glucokinase
MKQMKHAIAIDIGGTNIKYALVGKKGVILYERIIPSVGKGLMDTLKRIIRETLDFAVVHRLDVAGIGLGVPSIVDNGMVLFANNLPELNNIRPDQELSCFDLPVYMDNDANLMGLAESQYGAAQGASDVVFLTIGTGIGGALILNGQLYGGYRNRGTEMGHIIVNAGGNHCTCGAKGCLEAQASVTALINDYKERYPANRPCLPEQIDGMYIISRYLEREITAVESMQSHFYWLATGIAGYINIFAPQKVILGGGIPCAGDFYIENVRAYTRKIVMKETSLFTRIEAAQLGNKAGFLGAATRVFSVQP